jgi:hypothetical protein
MVTRTIRTLDGELGRKVASLKEDHYEYQLRPREVCSGTAIFPRRNMAKRSRNSPGCTAGPSVHQRIYGDERLIEYVKEMREGDYGDLPAHRPVDFFKRRVTMATWTLSHGWQADAKVTKKARKYKARLTREVPAWC